MTALSAAARARGLAPEYPKSGAEQDFNVPYTGERLSRVAFPMGGFGTGMICFEGSGALSHVSLRHRPDVFNEPCQFCAISVPAKKIAKVLEGPVPAWKIWGSRESCYGLGGTTYGLPRFSGAVFTPRFPFATVALADEGVPLQVRITGWSPFTPGDEDSSSLPVAALEYEFVNPASEAVDAVFSYNAKNFMAVKEATSLIRSTPGGFVFHGAAEPEKPWEEGEFSATVDDPGVIVNHAWFRGAWYDPLTMTWHDIAEGNCRAQPPVQSGPPSLGASLFVPFKLGAGERKTITLRFAWYVPKSPLHEGKDPAAADPATVDKSNYVPWYAAHFPTVEAVADVWAKRYAELRARSLRFAESFHATDLPPEMLEAAAANLAILKSPTVLRQADGRFWAWEGSGFDWGACPGSCTHVWNYAQAVPHLFPAMERSLRETEFGASQDERGHQVFRAGLPIRPQDHENYPAAADGQLGGIMKLHRDWRISGDTEWLRRMWPRARQSLDYCIRTWDPEHKGWVEEPHHNTYDIEFWGPDGMCSSIYLGALQAAIRMGSALGEDVSGYASLLAAGRVRVERELFNGEYFFQRIESNKLKAGDPAKVLAEHGNLTPEELDLLKQEGPKYQYGAGCLSDGIIGEWFARVCGVDPVIDPVKVRRHLRAVHQHNLKSDLTQHVNPQRPNFAVAGESGLLLCTWPRGGALKLPFVYSNEVWTGIEHQVAAHLLLIGETEAAREIVRSSRSRYDGRVRNPFDEYECGHWYARALASYAYLQGWTGARYDAVEKVLHVHPTRAGDFHGFICTATGFGTVGVRAGKPFLDVHAGQIDVQRVDYVPFA